MDYKIYSSGDLTAPAHEELEAGRTLTFKGNFRRIDIEPGLEKNEDETPALYYILQAGEPMEIRFDPVEAILAAGDLIRKASK